MSSAFIAQQILKHWTPREVPGQLFGTTCYHLSHRITKLGETHMLKLVYQKESSFYEIPLCAEGLRIQLTFCRWSARRIGLQVPAQAPLQGRCSVSKSPSCPAASQTPFDLGKETRRQAVFENAFSA